MVIFLDDGIGGGANKIRAKINSLMVTADLLKSLIKALFPSPTIE